MFNFCTLFDSAYLTRGLAMYESLAQHCPVFHLYIFAFDDKCYEILERFALPHATIIPLEKFENDSLRKVKPQRSRAEYCWTCTPSTICYVFENYGVDMCTYLDADLYFYASPRVLLEEMKDTSAMIVEHRFTRQYAWRMKFGKYCVQFMTFKNNQHGMKILEHWKNQCFDWCFARLENGRYGDQKYLDEWPLKFAGVHEMQHLGGGVAPWNVQQYDVFLREGKVFAREKCSAAEFEVIFYHIHYLKYYSNGTVNLGPYKLRTSVKDIFYRPYLLHLERIKSDIYRFDRQFDPHGTSKLTVSNWSMLSRYVKHLLQNNVIRLDKVLKGKWP